MSAFLPLAAFERVFDQPYMPKDFRNPYVWLLYAIIANLSQAQQQGIAPLPKEPVDFFFDRRDIERDKIWNAWETFKNHWAEHLIGQEPQFLDDKKTSPLQMADLSAGLARNYWRQTALGEKPKWNFPNFRSDTYVPYLTFTWTEERLRARLNELIAALPKKPLLSFTFGRWTYLKG